jgi:hypothetical protein
MRICDKCGKKLREGDGSSQIKLGYPFNYDFCVDCEQKFLLHVSSFFTKARRPTNERTETI